jgi:hypothetical protein
MERARVGFYNWDAASFLDEERRERRGGLVVQGSRHMVKRGRAMWHDCGGGG